jgi:hypothetical protein
MSGTHGGARPGAGRKPGTVSQQTREKRALADRAAEQGITPLELQLRTMRALWDEANKGETLDFVLAKEAAAIAKDAAPFVHPRLAATATFRVSSDTRTFSTEEILAALASFGVVAAEPSRLIEAQPEHLEEDC